MQKIKGKSMKMKNNINDEITNIQKYINKNCYCVLSIESKIDEINKIYEVNIKCKIKDDE